MSIDTTAVSPQQEETAQVEENPIIALARQGTRKDLLTFYARVINMLPEEDARRTLYLKIVDALSLPWRYQSEAALKDIRMAVIKEEEGERYEQLLPLIDEAIQALSVCQPTFTHFSILGTELRAAVAKLKDAVSTRSTLPVLSNALLELDPEAGLLWLSATNLEIAIRTSVEARIECAGDDPLTFPYSLLVDECEQILTTNEGKMRRITIQEVREEIPGGQVTNVQITNGAIESKYKASIHASEFPLIPIMRQEELSQPFIFQSSDLRRIINLITFAAAEDESRPVLAGVLMQLKDTSRGETHEIELAAADSFRLATISYESLFMKYYNQYDEDAPKGMLIPARTLKALLGGTKEKKSQLLPEDTSDVFFYCSANRSQVMITIPGSNVTLVSRLIEGTFPNFKQIIPRDGDHKVYAEASVAALKRAYKGLKTFAKDSSNISRFMIERVMPELGEAEDEDEVQEVRFKAWVSAEAEDLGRRTTMITEDVHNVEFASSITSEFGIIFNLKYMTDLLDHLEKIKGIDRVRIYLQAPTKPGKLVPIGLESYSYTIMPMHINR